MFRRPKPSTPVTSPSMRQRLISNDSACAYPLCLSHPSSQEVRSSMTKSSITLQSSPPRESCLSRIGKSLLSLSAIASQILSKTVSHVHLRVPTKSNFLSKLPSRLHLTRQQRQPKRQPIRRASN